MMMLKILVKLIGSGNSEKEINSYFVYLYIFIYNSNANFGVKCWLCSVWFRHHASFLYL